jgi:hypothetical protein
MERRACADRALGPAGAAVPVDCAGNRGQADSFTGELVVGVQSTRRLEELSDVGNIETDAVVGDEVDPDPLLLMSAEANAGPAGLDGELVCVCREADEKGSEQAGIGLLREPILYVGLDTAIRLNQLELAGDLAPETADVDRLKLERPSQQPGQLEDPLDQMAHPHRPGAETLEATAAVGVQLLAVAQFTPAPAVARQLRSLPLDAARSGRDAGCTIPRMPVPYAPPDTPPSGATALSRCVELPILVGSSRRPARVPRSGPPAETRHRTASPLRIRFPPQRYKHLISREFDIMQASDPFATAAALSAARYQADSALRPPAPKCPRDDRG